MKELNIYIYFARGKCKRIRGSCYFARKTVNYFFVHSIVRKEITIPHEYRFNAQHNIVFRFQACHGGTRATQFGPVRMAARQDGAVGGPGR
jgi:hypothetical protein